jgi:hypothetical protein
MTCHTQAEACATIDVQMAEKGGTGFSLCGASEYQAHGSLTRS